MSPSQTALVMFFVFCGLANAFTLQDGHNWGGDFAQYILHAQNLLAPKPYAAGIMLEHTIVYPPGFPLLLAPLLKIWGLNFLVLKAWNLIFWAGAVLVLYALTKAETDSRTALLAAMLLASSSVLFVFKQNILSDIPFLFFALATLYALKTSRLVWACGLLYFTILLRSAGLALSFAALFYFLAARRNLPAALSLLAASLLAIAVGALICQGVHPAFFNGLARELPHAVPAIARYAPTVWQSLAWSFVPGQTPLTSWLFLLCSWGAVILSPLLWLCLPWIFYRRFREGTLTLVECFFYFYLALLFVWSLFGDSPQQFNRFLFPCFALLPAVVYPLLDSRLKRRALLLALGACIAANVINTAVMFRYDDDDLLCNRDNQELFAWVRDHAKDGAHYMIWEPRTLALMSGRSGTTLAWLAANPVELWPVIMKKMGVLYLILKRSTDGRLIAALEENRGWSQKIWENPAYVIFQRVS